jgi:hypothetical protein
LRSESELAKEKESVDHLKTLVNNNDEERTRDDRKAKLADEHKKKLEEDLRQARTYSQNVDLEKKRQQEEITNNKNDKANLE